MGKLKEYEDLKKQLKDIEESVKDKKSDICSKIEKLKTDCRNCRYHYVEHKEYETIEEDDYSGARWVTEFREINKCEKGIKKKYFKNLTLDSNPAIMTM